MENEILRHYIKKQLAGKSLTYSQIEVLKNSEEHECVRNFLNVDNKKYIIQIASILRNLCKLLGNEVELTEVSKVSEISGDYIASQIMQGDTNGFLAIHGKESAIVKLASMFVLEQYHTMDIDVYDAVCELTNNLGGAFATELSRSHDIEVVLYPPMFYSECRIYSESKKQFYELTFLAEGEEFKVAMAIDNAIKVQD